MNACKHVSISMGMYKCLYKKYYFELRIASLAIELIQILTFRELVILINLYFDFEHSYCSDRSHA